jgi:uncharacterized protein (DUF2384 family)
MKKRDIWRNEEFTMLALKEKKHTSINIIDEAIRVFGDEMLAKNWLSKPNSTLDNQIPLQLSETVEGKTKVLGRLIQIDHGIYI